MELFQRESKIGEIRQANQDWRKWEVMMIWWEDQGNSLARRMAESVVEFKCGFLFMFKSWLFGTRITVKQWSETAIEYFRLDLFSPFILDDFGNRSNFKSKNAMQKKTSLDLSFFVFTFSPGFKRQWEIIVILIIHSLLPPWLAATRVPSSYVVVTSASSFQSKNSFEALDYVHIAHFDSNIIPEFNAAATSTSV